MPVTPTGPLHQFMVDLISLLSGLDSVQTFLSVVDQPSAAAVMYDYSGTPGSETEYMIFEDVGKFEWDPQGFAGTGLGGSISTRPVRVGLYRVYATPQHLDDSDNLVTFKNDIGDILQEAAEKQGTAGTRLTKMTLFADVEPGKVPTWRAYDRPNAHMALIDFDLDTTGR